MSIRSLQKFEERLDKFGEDLWSYDAAHLDFDGLVKKLLRLEAQVTVQRSLQTTVELLRQQPSDKPLPNQQAKRVKQFVKFIFGKASRGNDRSIRLRELECNTVKLIGLSYKIRDIHELPASQFDFLIEHGPEFVKRWKLSQYLNRDDLDKAINSKFDPDDDSSFKQFMKTHVDLRPSKRKRDVSPPNTHIAISSGAQAEFNGPPQPPQGRGQETAMKAGYQEHMLSVYQPLTGDVYELTKEDARAAASCNEISGTPWLTDPYWEKMSPFVIIPISKKLCKQFADKRPQLEY